MGFLRRTKVVIEKRAKDICDGIILVSHILFTAYAITGETTEGRTDKEHDTIINETNHIFRDGWNPTRFMIDKSLAEKGLLKGFVDLIPRVHSIPY